MQIYIFAKFHALEGKQGEAAQALKEVLGPTRDEPGCMRIHAFRSIRDGRLFYIHSKWKDEEVFENHAQLPHTVRFLKSMETLIDHAFEVNRTVRIGRRLEAPAVTRDLPIQWLRQAGFVDRRCRLGGPNARRTPLA